MQLNDDIPLPPKPSPSSSLSDHPRPPDQLLPIGRTIDPSDDSSGVTAVAADSGAHRQRKNQYGLEEEARGRGEEGEKRNDTRKGSISGSQTLADHVFSPSSPSNQDGRWCEGEKAIPLKKRRGSFERIKVEEYDEVTTQNNNNKKEKTRMKTKMNKKCSRHDDDQEDDVAEEGGEREVKRERNAGRKRARGSAVMEGSRCSRVNGRGWRCCQQTLVGYSLCEHHLGKGRLRSITSVKTRSVPATETCSQKPEPHQFSQVSTSSSPALKHANEGEQDQEVKKPETMAKKRMKLGVVKARSISSLLGQTNTHVPVLENNE